jgi:hypothetical protein
MYVDMYVDVSVDEYLCVKMIHNTKLFIVFCTAIILYTLHTFYVLYICDLFHILLSFLRI